MYDFDLENINYGQAFDVDNSLDSSDMSSDSQFFACIGIAATGLGIGLNVYGITEAGPNPGYAGWGTGIMVVGAGSLAMSYINDK